MKILNLFQVNYISVKNYNRFLKALYCSVTFNVINVLKQTAY